MKPNDTHRRRSCSAALASLVIALAACSGGSDSPTGGEADAKAGNEAPVPIRTPLQAPTDAKSYELMGNSVALHGDVAVVGVWDGEARKLRAFVFRHVGRDWKFEQRLQMEEQSLSPFVPGRDRIRTDGKQIAVSEHSALFVHRYDGRAWVQDFVLKREQLGPGQFEAMVVQGDRLAFMYTAGADPEEWVQTVHTYRRVAGEWKKEAELVPADGTNRGLEIFGSTLAIDGDLLVAASGSHTAGGLARGAAYVFRHGPGGWKQEARLTAADTGADPEANDRLGTSAAVSSTRILLGAPEYRDPSGNHGAIFEFLYRNGRWEPGARIVYAGAGENRFGEVLAMAGDTFVAGSPFALADWHGAAYVFRLRNAAWVSTDLAEEVPGPKQSFGFDVATDGRQAIVSSWGMAVIPIGELVPGLFPKAAEPEPKPVIRRGAAIYDLERGWQ